MSRLGGDCLFISARCRTNLDTLRQTIYNKVRQLHVQKYPYNDFLFQHYDSPDAADEAPATDNTTRQ